MDGCYRHIGLSLRVAFFLNETRQIISQYFVKLVSDCKTLNNRILQIQKSGHCEDSGFCPSINVSASRINIRAAIQSNQYPNLPSPVSRPFLNLSPMSWRLLSNSDCASSNCWRGLIIGHGQNRVDHGHARVVVVVVVQGIPAPLNGFIPVFAAIFVNGRRCAAPGIRYGGCRLFFDRFFRDLLEGRQFRQHFTVGRQQQAILHGALGAQRVRGSGKAFDDIVPQLFVTFFVVQFHQHNHATSGIQTGIVPRLHLVGSPKQIKTIRRPPPLSLHGGLFAEQSKNGRAIKDRGRVGDFRRRPDRRGHVGSAR